jgi:hypothetical protein
MKQKMAVGGFATLYLHNRVANFKKFSEETKHVVSSQKRPSFARLAEQYFCEDMMYF